MDTQVPDAVWSIATAAYKDLKYIKDNSEYFRPENREAYLIAGPVVTHRRAVRNYEKLHGTE